VSTRKPLRARLASSVSRGAAALSRVTGRGDGSVIGGRLGLMIDPRLLANLSAGRDIALVSGTNGKTTTTRLTAAALGVLGDVATNSLGANMPSGHTSALARAGRTPYAVLEVDEHYLPEVLSSTKPRVVALLNLSRDQLDRAKEVAMLADLWRRTLLAHPVRVVANADDPMVTWAAYAAADAGAGVTWVAAGQRWHDDSWVCPQCGSHIMRVTELADAPEVEATAASADASADVTAAAQPAVEPAVIDKSAADTAGLDPTDQEPATEPATPDMTAADPVDGAARSDDPTADDASAAPSKPGSAKSRKTRAVPASRPPAHQTDATPNETGTDQGTGKPDGALTSDGVATPNGVRPLTRVDERTVLMPTVPVPDATNPAGRPAGTPPGDVAPILAPVAAPDTVPVTAMTASAEPAPATETSDGRDDARGDTDQGVMIATHAGLIPANASRAPTGGFGGQGGRPSVPDADDWWCTGCSLRRPTPQWRVVGDAVIDTQGRAHVVTLQLPGRVNRANAATALAVAAEFGVDPALAVPRLGQVASVAGRYALVRRDGRTIRLLLAKNPAGWLEAFDMAEDAPTLLSINSRDPDGLDTSWLFDVDFSPLRGRTVLITGERAFDLAVRLDVNEIPFTYVRSFDDALRQVPAGRVEVIANYTAFQDIRAELDRVN
jgi:UDP-N-acetylmuramyl tripeptide synthase